MKIYMEYDKSKHYACDGCGFTDATFDTSKGEEILGCAKSKKGFTCDRVYEVKK